MNRFGKLIRHNQPAIWVTAAVLAALIFGVVAAPVLRSEFFIKMIVTTLPYGGIFVYPILQFWAIKRLRGWWRIVALLPLVPMVGILCLTGLMYSQGDNNMWPIPLLMFLLAALPYLILILCVHKLWSVVRPRGDRGSVGL